MTRGWAEKQRLGALSAYAKAEGSDIQQFASFDEEAQMLLSGGETAKIRPPQTSLWLAQTAADIGLQLAEMEKRIGSHRSKEFTSTTTDLKVLANLALYHSRRIPAAVSYRLFDHTTDPGALDQAIKHEREAVEAWQQLVQAAGDVYTDDLMMGVRGAALCGHWKDELTALQEGLTALERQRGTLATAAGTQTAPSYRPALPNAAEKTLQVFHQPVTNAPAGKPLTVTAEVRGETGVKWVRLRYRSVNQHQDYRTLPMATTDEKGQFRATIPEDEVVPAWDLMYFIEVMDSQGNGQIYPDLNKQTPYIIVKLRR
jgi:hypothetical protein